MKSLKIKCGLDKVPIIFLIYWTVLVIWQTVNQDSNLSAMDSIIKLALFALLIGYYFWCGKKVKFSSFMVWIIFTLCMIIPMFNENSIEMRTIVEYMYPMAFSFCVFVIGSNVKIDKHQYFGFLNIIIIVALYSALYAIIYMPEYFLNAFSINNAYGNELSSFFVSSHEYAMYLLGGIISCVLCYELNPKISLIKKIYYFLAAALFLINLILTFSRTTLLATAIFIVLYIFFQKKSKLKKWMLLIIGCAVWIFISTEDIRDFVFDIIMKGNNVAERDTLFELGVSAFKEAPLYKQVFGHGYMSLNSLIHDATGHSNLHNAYLQCLLKFGIVGLGFMIIALLYFIINAVKTIKVNRFLGVTFLAMAFAGGALMITNTSMIFNSLIDSFFLTIYFFVMPLYVSNSIRTNDQARKINCIGVKDK